MSRCSCGRPYISTTDQSHCVIHSMQVHMSCHVEPCGQALPETHKPLLIMIAIP